MAPLIESRPRGERRRQVMSPAAPARTKSPPAQGLRRFVGIALALLALLLWPLALSAREDSASLVFSKTAETRDTRVFVVKKGNSVGGLYLSQQGEGPVPYALIRQLNPEITDLNRIFPGQKIVLPVRAMTAPSPQPAAEAAQSEAPPPPDLYRVQEGDSLSRIILDQMKIDPTEVLAAVRILRRMNPEIEDLNQLSAGQLIRLPPSARQSDRPAAPAAEAATTLADKVSFELTLNSPPEEPAPLGMLRPVIGRMGGTVTTRGSHYIPLKEGAQISIDCSLIPVVELTDGSTLLLDFENRLSEDFKGLIRASWSHYGFVPPAELGDGLTALKGIIALSRNYRLVRTESPLTLSRLPEIVLSPDWLVAAKGPAQDGAPYRQAIHLLSERESALPPEVRPFLEKRGVFLTQIAAGREAPAAPGTAVPNPPVVNDLRKLRGIALAEALLNALGEATSRNTEVVIFDQARDGFKLSVTADLMIAKGEKRFIVQTKRLPDQFVRILNGRQTELITIGEADAGRALIETVLMGMGRSVSFGHHVFRIPAGDGRPRLSIAFPALRVTTDAAPLYLVDFDLTADTLPLLLGLPDRHFAKY